MTPRPDSLGDTPVTLDVSLAGRSYTVACKESERSDLLDAVALLDRRMREIRESGKIAGTERIAVMAALNIAHDLQRARRESRATRTETPASSTRSARAIDDTSARRRITAMQSAIDQVLAGQDQST